MNHSMWRLRGSDRIRRSHDDGLDVVRLWFHLSLDARNPRWLRSGAERSIFSE